MKIFIAMIITLVVISVITIVLIRRSVSTQETKIDWTALISGNLTVNVTMASKLPFGVTVEDLVVSLVAGGTTYFESKAGTIKLNPGLNVLSFTFVSVAPLNALGVAALVLKKKYLTIEGSVLGIPFSRSEEL